MADIADISDVIHELLEELIEFGVHYPTKDAAVITVTSSVNNSQLQTLVKHGAALEANGIARILFVPSQEAER